MKFYFAPLEGITGYIYRNAFHECFGKQISKYFSPFIIANQSDKFKSKEINDVLPENNKGLCLVPQLLTNQAQDFIYTANKLKNLGYEEVNLNLGCPSGTVVAKNKGSGFLAKQEQLDQFLEEIFSVTTINISVKTRIGKDDPKEFYELIKIFNKYPISELIIHPRIQKDFYNNKPNLKIFADSVSLSKNKVAYNGDIVSVESYKEFTQAFPSIDTVMIGRGLIANPGLLSEIQEGNKIEKDLLIKFHDMIYKDYIKVMHGDRNVLFKMKEIWFYMLPVFTDITSFGKKIRKTERLYDYEKVIDSLFKE
ncbi:MAG: tRNA-dihydrouridine synthase family protein [Mobilitalea sp.]